MRRGQADGTFDRALAPDWLLGVFFALLHAAAEQRLHGAADDPLADGLVATILKAFRPAVQARGDQTPAA